MTSNEAHAAVMKAMASKYELTAGGGGMQKLELIAEPVQRWSNPIRGQLDGCLFLWTLAGQPQAALSLYPTLDRGGWNHQFQSLSTGPLVATLDGAVAWIPDQPGIDYQTVPNAPAPADSAPRRLSQMRGMARRFTATVDTRGDKTALRLLTSPIYRYGREEGDPVDGAMFAWVQATDPELLLLLEARGSGDNCRWQYALARQTLWPLEVDYESQRVWSVEKWVRRTSHSMQSYFDRVQPAVE